MRPKMYNQFVCSSFMLPEHVESLDEYHAEELLKEAEYVPEVDEQEFEVWEQLIRQSLSKKKIKLSVTYLSGSKRETITGVAVEAGNAVLRIRDESSDKVKCIYFRDIISVTEGW